MLSSSPPSAASAASGKAVTRRLYWEVVGVRRAGGPSAAELLADRRLAPALAALRQACGAADRATLRIACVVELGEDVALLPILALRDALAAHDIGLDLWPQLDDESARFLNTSTAATYQARLLPLLDELEKCIDGKDIGLALDIEPREALLRAAWSVRDPASSLLARARGVGGVVKGVSRAVADARQGRRDLQELARDLAARELPVHAAVLPPLGSARQSDAWRTWALGCPVVDSHGEPLFGVQAAMCYAPMASKLPGKRQDRDSEKETLALWAARHRVRFDAVVVGQTATGILGDEPVYDDASVLAEDVRAMQALGFTDVGVYALEGLWFGRSGVPDDALTLRPDVDAWLAAAFGRSTTAGRAR